MQGFLKTAASFRQGAQTLSGEYFTSEAVFREECDTIHGRLWTCVGRSQRIAHPGDFLVREVAGESLIVVRGDDGRARAFFNVCRHRGTRLCTEPEGTAAEGIRCPYHAWTYATDGRLLGAPHMHDVEGFRREDHPLHEAACAESNGFLFVSLDRRAPAFAEWFAPMSDRLARFGLDALDCVHRVTYEVAANWKLVFQNYSECLHCPVIHPELAAVIPYQSSANDLDEGPFLGGCMDIIAPNQSVTASGRGCGAAVAPALAPEDRQRAFYYSVMPNLLINVHPDYVNCYLITPLSAGRTRIESEWLFAARDRQDERFDPASAISFWQTVNQQDWHIIEQAQLGIASRRYSPGPYSPRESIAAAWDREYLRLMNQRTSAKS